MCTLSWLKSEQGYQVFFNRDEQRTRQQALPPQHFSSEGTAVLMPIDPEGNGSWISTNEHKLSLCLLNFYQGSAPSSQLVSRGKLLRMLSHHTSLTMLNQQLQSTDLLRYAPFTLVAFSSLSDNSKSILEVQAIQWNGQSIQHFTPQSPFTSSSVKFEEVSKSRYQSYLNKGESKTERELTAFHSTHEDIKSYKSVCMHREDAKTVSFSHIVVDSDSVIFNYQNGSPCKKGEINSVTLLTHQ